MPNPSATNFSFKFQSGPRQGEQVFLDDLAKLELTDLDSLSGTIHGGLAPERKPVDPRGLEKEAHMELLVQGIIDDRERWDADGAALELAHMGPAGVNLVAYLYLHWGTVAAEPCGKALTRLAEEGNPLAVQIIQRSQHPPQLQG